jgi:E1-E2 ATPase/Citrate transporter
MPRIGRSRRFSCAWSASTEGRLLLASLGLLWVSAALSAIVDNIPYVATISPVVAELVHTAGNSNQSKALWWSLALGADVVILGLAERSGRHISFWEFTKYGLIVAIATVGLATPYRFLLALVFMLAILAWSGVGKSLFGHYLATPFGLDRDVWQLLLSLPVLYASRGFFTGAVAALRQRTLDMNVLVALAIGVSWVYSVAVTAGLSGEVFYDAGAMLATFVLLGRWFEMRARGSASDAIRTLLDLAPPKAVVLGDGEPVEVPTAEVAVGDLLLIRPGAKVPVDAEVTEGESEVDESTVTGESLPVHKSPGAKLVGATINKTERCGRGRPRWARTPRWRRSSTWCRRRRIPRPRRSGSPTVPPHGWWP